MTACRRHAHDDRTLTPALPTKESVMAHHHSARAAHFDMTHKHKAGHDSDGAHDGHLRHSSDHRNKSHIHNAVRHLSNETMLSEAPVESHKQPHTPDKPGV